MAISAALHASLEAAKATVHDSQRDWAKRQTLPCDTSGWLTDVKDNLAGSMTTEAHAAFSAGAGNELHGKMRAPHSSSALAYNMLSPAEKDPAFQAALAELLGVQPSSGDAKVRFEVKRPTGWQGTPPHLDAEIDWHGQTVAIESKFAESFAPKTSIVGSMTPYVKDILRSDPRWQGLGPLYDLATSLDQGARAFTVLDAPQLIKHMIGLANARRNGDLVGGVTLALLWYDASQVEPRAKLACDTLRDEFAAFVRAVNPCFDVRSFTHQDLFRTYEQQVPTRDSRLAWLKARYF